jgi:regulator of replication initiation timing
MGNSVVHPTIHYDKHIDFYSLEIFDTIHNLHQIIILLNQEIKHLHHILKKIVDINHTYNVSEIGKTLSRLIYLNCKIYEFENVDVCIVKACDKNNELLTKLFRENTYLTNDNIILKEINDNICTIQQCVFQ